ncbi:hypothetical protein NHU_03695 [Rhodovulum sulfidophilum]|uniref:DUF302 domain-containing protein n=1 Tax=Rhodovulum sulfidophilum TaxID=35806 RepID=A0A0D6B715_RHOSU|nr:hypothetical protein NHU_03695 [Rhodovulum sulfidophilum]
MKALLTATTLAAFLAAGAVAAAPVTYTTSQSFEDVAFELENAITGRGLVIDHVSHPGEMLERTRADLGSDKTIFLNADIYSFCPAALSRKVMEIDPLNIRFCPYDIFVVQYPKTPGKTTIGYSTYPEGPMKEVEELLDSIVREVVGLD